MIHNYSDLISIENLFQAWDEFKKGKRKKKDVQEFEFRLEDNLFKLHKELESKIYSHGTYEEFYVNDPKRRHIHKASVGDRVVHHLLYKYLYELFDSSFIYDSYSCRLDKGTHKAVKRLEYFTLKVSRNYTANCWVLHLDIKKFFASVDHETLINLISKKVLDSDILWLIKEVIESFCSEKGPRKGIPLGNLTSQIFSNFYLNELDQFIKHKLKIKYYIRYADDFVIVKQNKVQVCQYTSILVKFLKKKLKLELHPDKIILRKFSWGIDFLGYIVLPHHILPRKNTKKRIFRNLKGTLGGDDFSQSLASYMGYLSHASSYKVRADLFEKILET